MSLQKIPSLKSTNASFILIGMSTAILLVTPVIILLAIGYFFDGIFHTRPLLMILGIIVGFVSGIMNVFKLLKLMQKNKK